MLHNTAWQNECHPVNNVTCYCLKTPTSSVALWPGARKHNHVFTYIEASAIQYLTPHHNRHRIHEIKKRYIWLGVIFLKNSFFCRTSRRIYLIYWYMSLYWKAQLPSAVFDDSRIYALSCHAVEHPQLAYWDSGAFKYNMPHSKQQACMNSTSTKAKLLSSQHGAINQDLQGER